MIFKLRRGLGQERKGMGRAYKKGKKVGRGDKSQSTSSEGGFKDYQASHLKIPLGWVWKPKSIWAGLERGQFTGKAVSRSGPLGRQTSQAFLLRPEELSREGSRCQWEAWAHQAAQDGCTLWLRALSRASHPCTSEKKWGVILFRADGDCRWLFFLMICFQLLFIRRGERLSSFSFLFLSLIHVRYI